MNGKMMVSKPLYVAVAERKKDRRAKLQAQFSQMRPILMAPYVDPQMRMYYSGGPSIGQQIFYGQAPSQPVFGYQQQLVPYMRHGGAPVPNFLFPMIQQGQHPGGIFSVPYDVGGFPLCDVAHQQVSIGAFALALTNATSEQQRTMMWENLYPRVEQLEPNNTSKVTSMLLDMEMMEVLHLLKSPEALKAKVTEVMITLRNVAQQQQAGGAADQLASLSLADNLIS